MRVPTHGERRAHQRSLACCRRCRESVHLRIFEQHYQCKDTIRLLVRLTVFDERLDCPTLICPNSFKFKNPPKNANARPLSLGLPLFQMEQTG